jgi:uncharacterized GH25 family protein
MTRRPVPAAVKRAALGFILCGAVSLFAHYTWLSPAPAEAGVGDTVTVLLASGHAFPVAEAPVQGVALTMTVFDPSGKPVALAPQDKGRGPEAAFKAEVAGLYVVAGELDRGVISRTPDGWKPGGKSEHPNAVSAMKSYNSFLCAVRTSGPAPTSAAPRGLAFEISWKREGRRLSALATAANTPVEGAEISVIIGSGDSKPTGKSDAQGKVGIDIPEGFKGPILVIASLSNPAPAGSDYDLERKSSSHFLTWE